MDHDEILHWLTETGEAALEQLWRRADQTRRRHVGDAVHLRGLVEFSNHCSRQCGYCGIRAGNTRLARYRMSAGEILACARLAARLGYGTVVLQSGEDPGTRRAWMTGVVRQIRAETGLAVTLSLGERGEADLRAWREAGAGRYLLRFETSNPALFRKIHPPRRGRRSDRIALLRQLRGLGYEVGSGVMIGIPGQTYADLARDLELFRELDLDMIGVGPFLPHPETPLGRGDASRTLNIEHRTSNVEINPQSENQELTTEAQRAQRQILDSNPQSAICNPQAEYGTQELRPEGSNPQSEIRNPQAEYGTQELRPEGSNPRSEVRNPMSDVRPPNYSEQVPNSELMTYKVVALARLLCPDANIPSTTALATVNRESGRELGLQRGANVVMPNLTPPRYRASYEIYPAKACLQETPVECHACLLARLASIGRTVGEGPGASPRFRNR